MADPIKISVVIPIYNRVNEVSRCVENVLSQSYKNYELILVNDASTDGSGDKCADYAKSYNNITLINNPTNLGPGLSRNAGLDAASGDYIVFLDSDDRYERRLLSTVAKASAKKPDIIVYSLWEEYYDKSGRMIHKYCHSLPSSYLNHPIDVHRYAVLLEEETMLGYPWNKAYNLDYLRRTGARFTDTPHIEDILFNIEAFEEASSLVILEDKLYHYLSTADNRLTDKSLDNYFELQTKRISRFYAQQKRWGTLDKYALSVLSAEYYRWLLSAVERQVYENVPTSDIAHFLGRQYKSRIYKRLRYKLNAAPKLRLLYQPMIRSDIYLTIALAKGISNIKHALPGVFSALKQTR